MEQPLLESSTGFSKLETDLLGLFRNLPGDSAAASNPVTILDACSDPALFGPWFTGTSWTPWRAFLGALFGLPLSDEEAKVYRECTGRETLPDKPATEGWVIVGRRGGKSRIAALIGIYLACFRDYTEYLASGEVGTLAIIAADRRQARVVMRYLTGFLEGVPELAKMVTARSAETIKLSNRVAIEVHTASFRAVRGYTLIGVIGDEIAFWRTADDSANPDTEILNGLRPGMATIPGSMLLAISSGYARRGALYQAYRDHYGQDGDGTLVWKASTEIMHPDIDPEIIRKAYEDDPEAAAAEYGGEFRRDIESFVPRETVEACAILGRRELPPSSDITYRAFVDPSGGSQDSMTLAIAHDGESVAVVDAVRERRPPFSPADVVEEFATLLKSYRVTTVTGDRYAGEWPREQFRNHGIEYAVATRTKSDMYRDLLPILNSGQVELLDHKRMITQLSSLERRTARGGRDSIDHAPGAHDDVANAVAGVVVSRPKDLGGWDSW